MKQFVFAGNRFYVLQRMLDLNLNITNIFAWKGSYLEKYLIDSNIKHEIIGSKEDFFNKIDKLDFDYFVSNGLSYILPISKLKKKNKKFINIHPSYLPDLKGKSPVQGSILFKRDMGATCHYMDDGIDTGDIISQIKIPYSDDLDSGLLYKLCFKIEPLVFEEAYKKNFCAKKKQDKTENSIYYSYKENDRLIDIEEQNLDLIDRKIRAFSVLSKGAIIKINNHEHNVIKMDIIRDKKLIELINKFNIVSYDNYILVNKDNYILRFLKNSNNAN